METIRMPNELALSTGRSYQSQETGFLHLSHSLPEGEIAHSIPFVENLLFSLACLQSKTQEGMLEGKALLSKLLHFQASSGNFPVYLHEFPSCLNPLLGIHALPPLYWICFHFHTILGAELKRVQEVVHKLLAQSLSALENTKAPEYLRLKLGASAAAFGNLFNSPGFKEAGSKILKHEISESCYFSPKAMAELLIASQMIYPSLARSPWEDFLEWLKISWNPFIAAYSGPAQQRFQRGGEAEATLYDLFMGSTDGHFPERVFKRHHYHLQAALIQPWQDVFDKNSFSGTSKGKDGALNWTSLRDPAFSLSLIEKNCDVPPNQEMGLHPLCLVWGDAARLRSFVLQGGNISKISYSAAPGKIELLLCLREHSDLENRELSREIAFYTEDAGDVSFSIEGNTSTTFKLGEKVVLETSAMRISLTFLMQEGEGRFRGHIMKGNRPSQILKNPQERFSAFDWQIFLRTISRKHPSTIKVIIGYEKRV